MKRKNHENVKVCEVDFIKFIIFRFIKSLLVYNLENIKAKTQNFNFPIM